MPRRHGLAASLLALLTLAAVHAPARAGHTPDPNATSWNGLAPLLRFTAALDPRRSVHQIEFAFADIGNTLLDSALFVSALQGLELGPGWRAC